MKSTFEKMGGTYTLGADGIYYPNLVSTDEEPHYGKYGMIRKTYLKEHRPATYSLYMLEDRLTEHLNAVDNEAQEEDGYSGASDDGEARRYGRIESSLSRWNGSER